LWSFGIEIMFPWKYNNGIINSIVQVARLGQNSSHILGTVWFITLFTNSRLWILTRTSWLQSTPLHLTALRSMFVLPYHLRQNFSSNMFSWRLPTNIIYKLFIFPWSGTSSDSIVTGLWGGWLRNRSSVPESSEIFLFSTTSRPALMLSNLLNVGALSSEQSGRGVKLNIYQVLSMLSIRGATPPRSFMSCSLIKYGNNFTFPLTARFTAMGVPRQSKCGGPYQ
jgi:hypothetical protein